MKVKKEVLIEELESYLVQKLKSKKLSKDRLSESEYDQLIDFIFKKIHNLIKKKVIKILLKSSENYVIVDDVINIHKSYKLEPKGEMDFYYYYKFKIYDEFQYLFDLSISMLLEHKYGKSKKIVYQVFRDIIYDILNTKPDIVIGSTIYKGKYLYTVLSAQREKNGYIISSHNMEKFFGDEVKNKTMFLTNKKLEMIYSNYIASKNGMKVMRNRFCKMFL